MFHPTWCSCCPFPAGTSTPGRSQNWSPQLLILPTLVQPRALVREERDLRTGLGAHTRRKGSKRWADPSQLQSTVTSDLCLVSRVLPDHPLSAPHHSGCPVDCPERLWRVSVAGGFCKAHEPQFPSPGRSSLGACSVWLVQNYSPALLGAQASYQGQIPPLRRSKVP